MKYFLLISLILILSGCSSIQRKEKFEYLQQCFNYTDSIYLFIDRTEETNHTVEVWKLKLKFLQDELQHRFGPLADYPESKPIYDKLCSYISTYNNPDSTCYTHDRALIYNELRRGELYKLMKAEYDKLPVK